MDELDAATLAKYREALEDAADVLGRRGPFITADKLRGATSALFAAIERERARERDIQDENAAMREIMRAVAACELHDYGAGQVGLYNATTNVGWMREQARALLKGKA